MLHSPTPSIDSADDALFELLGVNGLSWNENNDDDDDDSIRDSNNSQEENSYSNKIVNNGDCRDYYKSLTPPLHCHRPHTGHSPILLVSSSSSDKNNTCDKKKNSNSSSSFLTQSQCNYIIKTGYNASNNGGKSHGPQYITEAAHNSSITSSTTNPNNKVRLQNPNHHKVCVFTNDLIFLWIKNVISQYFGNAIQDWFRINGYNNDNGSSSIDYSINPRLRLLRYDAIDEDNFLPHYDATTTNKGNTEESKITVLLYLNTGSGIHYEGGSTLFLNSLSPKDDFLSIRPECGKFVLFNHELYHASEELIYNEEIPNHYYYISANKTGGSKFVLRTDIMFPKQEEDKTSIFQKHPITTTEKTFKVNDILSNLLCNKKNVASLTDVLQELDMYDLPVRSFLVPGKDVIMNMLFDLGIDQSTVIIFCKKCQEALSKE